MTSYQDRKQSMVRHAVPHIRDCDQSTRQQCANYLNRAMELAPVAVAAAAVLNPPAIPFNNLSLDNIYQLLTDGTHGEGQRSMPDAEKLYLSLPEEVRTSHDAISRVLQTDAYEGGHIVPYSHGGSNDADNIQYMPTHDNRVLGANIPTAQQRAEMQAEVRNEGLFLHNPAAEAALNALEITATGSLLTASGNLAAAVGHGLAGDGVSAVNAVTAIPQTIINNIPATAVRAATIVTGDAIGNAVGDIVANEVAGEMLGNAIGGFAGGGIDIIRGLNEQDPEEADRLLKQGATKTVVVGLSLACPAAAPFLLGGLLLNTAWSAFSKSSGLKADHMKAAKVTVTVDAL